jgi:hypothetical protein
MPSNPRLPENLPMPRTALPWLILATILVSAALAWWTLTRSVGGEAITRLEHRDLAPFHEIEVGGNAAVTLLQTQAESIDVEAAGRTSVAAEVAHGRLVIRARDRRRWWNGLFGRRSPAMPHVTVRFRALDAIVLTGNVKMDVPQLSASALRIGASGGSALAIDELRATSLRIHGSGALDAKLAGRVEKEEVSISGAGSYDAEKLVATDASVSVSGVGNVIVHATSTLGASISGAGVIEYVGNPTVTEHVSGIGRVKRREPERASGFTTVAAPARCSGASAPAQCNGGSAPAQCSGAAAGAQCIGAAAPAQCSGASADAPWSLKNSGPPVTGSMSAWTPAMKWGADTRQSRNSASSMAATSCTVS